MRNQNVIKDLFYGKSLRKITAIPVLIQIKQKKSLKTPSQFLNEGGFTHLAGTADHQGFTPFPDAPLSEFF